MHAGERGDAGALVEVERVKMFLKVLEWPGPDRKLDAFDPDKQIEKAKEIYKTESPTEE